MGHHYVPRQHLRRFAVSGANNCVWMYDKQTRRFCQAGIASVAQESEYYDPEIEKALADVVEGPGKIAIDKLLNREKIDNAERSSLSLYFMIMVTRGPRQRRKSLEHSPEILAQIISDTEVEIRQWIADEPGNPMAHRRLQELEEVRAKFSAELPQGVIDQVRRPFWSERTVGCIHNMFWHIVPAPPGAHFVTSDTPAHFFECFGVGTLESEYTITLSKDFALIGERRRNAGIGYEKPQARIAREINRRILSHAERFVFSPSKGDWIETVVQKKAPYLSRINWGR
ncbi:MAG TPA: DUF4238 domain-containing protein [Pirellulales bacterium]|nr:DUF4238 domain-containing protein [Pirellulales bacterium]